MCINRMQNKEEVKECCQMNRHGHGVFVMS
jgi:hypothetical protein